MKDNYNDAPDYQISITFEDNKYSGIGEIWRSWRDNFHTESLI